MAVPAQFYPENLGILPMRGLGLQMQQDWVVNNYPVPSSAIDPDLCFSLQDLHHQQNNFLFPYHHLQQNPHQDFAFIDSYKGASSSTSSTSVSSFSPSMAASPLPLLAQLELQRQELDCILYVQSERLRSALQEQRKQQLGLLFKSVERKAMNLMRQKEEDLAQATKKAMELEVCLRKAEMESASWQKLARANEAMVINLSNTLEQVKERMIMVSSCADDSESVCCGSCDDNDGDNTEREVGGGCRKIACKCCNSGKACVLFLPCRHLCSCKQCEAFLISCPVCKSAKEASMEILWV